MRVKLRNTTTNEVVEIYLKNNQLDSSYGEWVIWADDENNSSGQCHGTPTGCEILDANDDL